MVSTADWLAALGATSLFHWHAALTNGKLQLLAELPTHI